MRVWQIGLLGLVLNLGTALAQEPVPAGEEFVVTSTNSTNPAVAADAQGNFVVVWSSFDSYGTDDSGFSVQGQRYDAAGAPVGGHFQVNTYTTNNQGDPAVAADAQGNFVVVWTSTGSYGTDTDDRSIQGQRYDTSGAPVGGEFQVNDYTTSSQRSALVAVDADGDFVVVWESYGSFGSDADFSSIQAQRYDTNGDPLGGQFQVNDYSTSYQFRPTVASSAQGNFVVVWESLGSYGTDMNLWSLQAQRYDASGASVGGQFQVNTYTTGAQRRSAVSADALGNFVVAWQSAGSYGTDTDDRSIQGQRYDAAGVSVGGQFQVNSYTTSYQLFPVVAAGAQGNFVVVWQSNGSYGTDTDGDSVQAQSFDANGVSAGGEFQVNTYTTSNQRYPVVAADAQGNFVVLWVVPDIRGQRFSVPIFTDGFETGDTSAWSSTVP